MGRSKKDNRKNRQFGFAIVAVCLVFVAYHYLKSHTFNTWMFMLGLLFFLMALLFPTLLQLLRVLMETLGHWLGIANTYVLLTIIYVLFFVPINLIFRITVKDILNLKRDSRAKSYWADSPKQADSSMRNQY